MIVEFLSDKIIGRCVPYLGNLGQNFGMGDHLTMLVGHEETKQKCFVFTCMQLVSTNGGPQCVKSSGYFAITFFSQMKLCCPCSYKSAKK
jgi:hypothetical protein